MAMGLVEASRTVDSIVSDLFISTNTEQVEDVFTKNKIADKTDRIQLLRRCMHVLDTSDTNDTLSVDDEYSDELEIFLCGKWRYLI